MNIWQRIVLGLGILVIYYIGSGALGRVYDTRQAVQMLTMIIGNAIMVTFLFFIVSSRPPKK